MLGARQLEQWLGRLAALRWSHGSALQVAQEGTESFGEVGAGRSLGRDVETEQARVARDHLGDGEH
jgi:hypothetical protein